MLNEWDTSSHCISKDVLPLEHFHSYYFIFSLSRKGWWTVKAPEIVLTSRQPALVERGLFILTQLLHLSVPRAWKTVQLSCIALWNVTARSPEIQRRVVEMGVCVALLDICNRHVATRKNSDSCSKDPFTSPSLRNIVMRIGWICCTWLFCDVIWFVQ